jgi:hypothetical protein
MSGGGIVALLATRRWRCCSSNGELLRFPSWSVCAEQFAALTLCPQFETSNSSFRLAEHHAERIIQLGHAGRLGHGDAVAPEIDIAAAVVQTFVQPMYAGRTN